MACRGLRERYRRVARTRLLFSILSKQRRCPVPVLRYLFLGLTAFSFAGFGAGGQGVANWPAPLTWTPPRPHGVNTLSQGPPLPFIPVTPCPVSDPRGNRVTAG